MRVAWSKLTKYLFTDFNYNKQVAQTMSDSEQIHQARTLPYRNVLSWNESTNVQVNNRKRLRSSQ